MGRWLKKLDSVSTGSTKLTQPTSVGFVSTTSENSHKNIEEKIGLVDVVKKCCDGLSVEAQQVIDGLLSSDDEQDIINGDVPVESLRLHIKLWVEAGKPHYSGKKLEVKV